ncbi:hypothetical protein O8C86_08165 [Aliarcobacter butzleri]|uniref:hypothetical protein n=2 Tax=Aliarcobacter butzleri TaxID=28197 RepID=UPI00263E8778|nr:hypothetical protein [Aliarcobacter butzleri]MDN5061803.1 hypothetical protein [Aliarcobacter butzleri]
MKGLKLIRKNQDDLQIGFKTKFELKKNEFYQDILKSYHSYYKKEGAKLECLCNNVDMACKKTSYYFLSNLPNNSNKHSEDCIYYEHLEDLTDSEDKYRSLIFKEPILNFSTATQKEKDEYNQKESHRKNTYVNFCTDMISEAMSIAFNRKNKDMESRANLSYPNYQDFLNSFDRLINNNELLPNGSIRKSLDKYYNFCYGVVDYDFISQLQDKQKEYDLYLPTVKKLYDGNMKFIEYGKATINCEINFYTLRATSELVKNFNNYISGPYFFMAIYKQNKENKKIVRLFLHPVYFDNDSIVFVDSGYERKYAKNLLENKVPFMKPITDSCFYKINGRFVNYEKEDSNFTRASLQFLPDFIEFSENKIDIVEVSGYDNAEYQNLMDRKIKHYKNESVKSNGLYQVKVVNGREL